MYAYYCDELPETRLNMYIYKLNGMKTQIYRNKNNYRTIKMRKNKHIQTHIHIHTQNTYSNKWQYWICIWKRTTREAKKKRRSSFKFDFMLCCLGCFNQMNLYCAPNKRRMVWEDTHETHTKKKKTTPNWNALSRVLFSILGFFCFVLIFFVYFCRLVWFFQYCCCFSLASFHSLTDYSTWMCWLVWLLLNA